MGFSIIGTGHALPANRVKNEALTQYFDTSDEWIRTRTGITERRVLVDESVTGLAAESARQALEKSGVKAEDIQLIICATMSGDYITPSLASLIVGEIGAKSDCLAFDINMACCGFVYALSIADGFFRAGTIKTALVIAAEGMTRLVDWKDRSTAVLFGDGAGAAVLTASEKNAYFDVCTKSDHTALYALRAGDNCPMREPVAYGFLKMNGQEVYKFASDAIEKRIIAVLNKAGLSAEQVDQFILHQANHRIIESAIYKLQLPKDRFPENIARFGNTSAASIPILLDELLESGTIKKGQKIVLCAFGAGLTSISCLITL